MLGFKQSRDGYNNVPPSVKYKGGVPHHISFLKMPSIDFQTLVNCPFLPFQGSTGEPGFPGLPGAMGLPGFKGHKVRVHSYSINEQYKINELHGFVWI